MSTPKYECVLIKFLDIGAVINRRNEYRTFQTRMFNAGNLVDEACAFAELFAMAGKFGFTKNEIRKAWRQPVDAPKPTAVKPSV